MTKLNKNSRNTKKRSVLQKYKTEYYYKASYLYISNICQKCLTSVTSD